jgi:hypothetical protein
MVWAQFVHIFEIDFSLLTIKKVKKTFLQFSEPFFYELFRDHYLPFCGGIGLVGVVMLGKRR